MIIEFFGLPGSGKSFFSKKFINFSGKKNELINYQELFFRDYFISQKKTIITKIFSKLYFYYVKKNYIKSQFLFKKYYEDLLNQIRSYNFNDYQQLIDNYKLILEHTPYSKERKNRLINNFLIELIAYDQKKKFNLKNSKIIFTDEGFYQKCFLNFKDLKNKNLIKLIKEFLIHAPKIDIGIFIEVDEKISFERIKNRKYGFKYYNDNYSSLESYTFIINNIFHILDIKNIEIIKIRPEDTIEYNLDLILKKIN